MAQIQLSVPKIHCDGCVRTVTRAVGKLAGIRNVSASAETHHVVVEYDEGAVTENAIRESLQQVGYPAA